MPFTRHNSWACLNKWLYGRVTLLECLTTRELSYCSGPRTFPWNWKSSVCKIVFSSQLFASTEWFCQSSPMSHTHLYSHDHLRVLEQLLKECGSQNADLTIYNIYADICIHSMGEVSIHLVGSGFSSHLCFNLKCRNWLMASTLWWPNTEQVVEKEILSRTWIRSVAACSSSIFIYDMLHYYTKEIIYTRYLFTNCIHICEQTSK